MNILLIQPPFPKPAKSRNHSSHFPIGLLKIGSYHMAQGDKVRLHVGNHTAPFCPDEIKITSLFTYWSAYVHESARFYHEMYPNARIEIGGIYASLMTDHCGMLSPFAEVCPGLYRDGIAENHLPAYELLDQNVDFQIMHTSRGCPRKCAYCAVWRVEPDVTYECTIKEKIRRRRIIFYDNNLLMNPHIDHILSELAEYKSQDGRTVWCECQSGFDRRLLCGRPELAVLLRKAHFHNPRLAWDGHYDEWEHVKESLAILRRAGYPKTELYIFMLYNYQIPYEEMRRKLEACRRWGVRVVDCRYRPLNSTIDGYNPVARSQSREEYYVHHLWTDKKVRSFRRAVRRQNIAVMLGLPDNRYLVGCEKHHVAT